MKRKTTIIHKIKRKKRKQKDCRKLIKKFIESFKSNKKEKCSIIEVEQKIKREISITDLMSGENIKFSASLGEINQLEVDKRIKKAFDSSIKSDEYSEAVKDSLIILGLLKELYRLI